MWTETPAHLGPYATTRILKIKRKSRRKPWNLRPANTTLSAPPSLPTQRSHLHILVCPSPPLSIDPRSYLSFLSTTLSHFLSPPHLLLSLSTTKERKKKKKEEKESVRQRFSFRIYFTFLTRFEVSNTLRLLIFIKIFLSNWQGFFFIHVPVLLH